MNDKYVLTVSQLNEYVNNMLRNDLLLGSVSIRGEISGFKRHSSGHIYFSMKDENALVRCVMFRQNAIDLPVGICDGAQVIASGYASLYSKDGQFQFYVKSIAKQGEGELYRRFLLLKTRLEARGFFAKEHKKALPLLPKCVGIVTSPTGAAIQDIVNITRRRYPMMDILASPTAVQGTGAAEQIADAINLLDKSGLADVIIVGRGGGSIEELWAFNEEPVAKAIYECSTPIVSAVGHETDFTIADFVADMRAPTPSAAAELCVPEYEGLCNDIAGIERHLTLMCKRKLDLSRSTVDVMAKSNAFYRCGYRINAEKEALDGFFDKLRTAAHSAPDSYSKRLDALSAKLDSLSPNSVLKRGYAMAMSKGKAVTTVAALSAGEKIHLIFNDGSVDVTVNDIHKG